MRPAVPSILVVTSFVFLCAASTLSGQDPLEGGLLDRGEPRIYTGEHLEAVGMPVGGIGTGNIWIAGDGSLSVWQIFNNMNGHARIPDSFFAVRVKEEGKDPRVLSLDSMEREGFGTLGVESFRGDYPFAWLAYASDPLPVEVRLEAFNPMIPLNVLDSSLPCALYRLTASNPGNAPVEVSFASMLQNAVGYDGTGKVEDCRFEGYGLNQNVVGRGDKFTLINCYVPEQQCVELKDPLSLLYYGPTVRQLEFCKNLELTKLSENGPASEMPDVDACWFHGLRADSSPAVLDTLVQASNKKGIVLLESPEPSFYERLTLERENPDSAYTVFEDFEGGDYDTWTREGEAFGAAPSTGTSPKQNPVSGFMGQGLVNTYVPDDRPRGRLVSRAFKIEHEYIGFLVGGGAHAGRTCINLKVDGEIVRTTTGKDNELLLPAQWETKDLIGAEAVIEIVDDHEGGWGHINVDQIVFSQRPPISMLGREEAFKALAAALPFDFKGEPQAFLDAGWEKVGSRFIMVDDGEEVDELIAVVKGSFGEATMILFLEGRIDASHALQRIMGKSGNRLLASKSGIPADALSYGSMCLAVMNPEATFTSQWTSTRDLANDLLDDGRIEGSARSLVSPLRETYNCALAVPFTLAPGETQSVDFAICWSFPNAQRFGHKGNLYGEKFESAWKVAAYVGENFQDLRNETLLYHDTLYETNLPYWMLDCLSSQSCIFRTVLCFFAREHAATGQPYFAGYEGCYGCCPLNCTHVWNYAQTHARLYPDIGRNLRWFDFAHYMKEDGETQHRQHTPHGAFIDGHCAVIEGVCREYMMSTDDGFLKELWPRITKAVEWLIRAIDEDEDGVNAGHQWNTYDVATSGAHTFIGSQYLSALAAAEKMAEAVGDEENQKRWAAIREAGTKNQDALLWNGEYYIQIPEEKPARDYNTGCHSDQLLGQWWAHMLDTGRLYPEEHVRTALASIYKYNLKSDFKGFEQRPRRYVVDEDGGLLMCTWPKGDRPDPFILYVDEVWTGIEYSTASLMIYEGLIEEAFHIVKTARDRYDGRIREGLDSGPGGNPFNELECGRFYARALSSWSLLLAAQGFIYEGPKAKIGFIPRWKPEDHKSFFCAAEGYGLFSQRVDNGTLDASIEVRAGRLRVKEVVLGNQFGQDAALKVEVIKGDQPVGLADSLIKKDRVVISLTEELVLEAGDVLTIRLTKE